MEDISIVDNVFINESDLLDYVDNIQDPVEQEPETIKEDNEDTVIEEEKEEDEALKEDIEEDIKVDPENVIKESEVKNDTGNNTEVEIFDILDSIRSGHVSDNQAVVVSDNIIEKPINDYTTIESYSFLIFISIFIVGVVYLIRKGIPKWK